MPKVSVPIAQAVDLAERIRDILAPACERIEIGGSVRRRAPFVGDIEVVAIAKRIVSGDDLFGLHRVSALDKRLEELLAVRRLLPGPGGNKYKQFGIPAMPGLNLDLFIVTHETWAVQFAIRTGPREFSRQLVTPRSKGGRLQDGLVVYQGHVWGPVDEYCPDGLGGGRAIRDDLGDQLMIAIDPPEEAGFLELAGGWIAPVKRRAAVAPRDQPCP